MYASTKHALNGFFNSLRIEVERYGVSICIALPGTIRTDIREKAKTSSAPPKRALEPDHCARIIVNGACRKKKQIYIPGWTYAVSVLYTLIPDIIDYFAKVKYSMT